MGATQSKASRTAPARFVAKSLPRAPKDIQDEFTKAQHTLTGVNNRTEKVANTPQPYVEVGLTNSTTTTTEQATPKWQLNTWMEMMDNVKESKIVITGNLPNSWERDRSEPYSLIRNRIDAEDMDWLMHEGKSLPIEQLVEQTKLERETLEDILATVEPPRRQFRNYQGKLHKTIEDPNTYLADRKKRISENREVELLKNIGYSDEEMVKEEQYNTNRSRGVKTLDQLGASIQSKKRRDRAAAHDDMELLLEQRKIAEIEDGTYEVTKEEAMARPAEVPGVNKKQQYVARQNPTTNIYRLDAKVGTDGHNWNKMAWWAERRKTIPYGPDHTPDAPVYNERLEQTEESAKDEMDRSAVIAKQMAQAQGAKGFFDPRKQYGDMLDIMRAQNTEGKSDAEINQRRWGAATGQQFAEEALRERDDAVHRGEPVAPGQHVFTPKQGIPNQAQRDMQFESDGVRSPAEAGGQTGASPAAQAGGGDGHRGSGMGAQKFSSLGALSRPRPGIQRGPNSTPMPFGMERQDMNKDPRDRD
jgi:hypothetical protein